MAAQQERAVVDLVINGQQAQVSMKDLAAATINARKALYSMAETDPGYKKQKAELEALMKAQQARIVRIHEEKTAWQKFVASAGSVTAGITGANVISTGLGLIQDGFRKAREEFKLFDAASKELSAVTGATGADLEYLNQQAKNTGPQFGKSGAEMLEAYKLMASAKPELLAQKELLVETTQAAITLSRAGKIDLAEATKVTAESLNQFGQGADQANRFINVIAAGAKEGSAEINEMGIALKNSGTVASAQNVSFEQTNAILQSLSTIALKGGEAGTQLRNVLLTLGSGSDDTNPKVVGLEKALQNLEKKNLSTAEMTKLFGKENITAAQHIITHRKEIEELTRKVTGTDEAFSQAAKNNATYEQKLAQFDATLSKVAVTIGAKVVPALTTMMDWVMKGANWLDQQLAPASEKAARAFEDQRAQVQSLTKNIAPLLTRHDQLKAKTTLTKGEQDELKKIVGQVASVIPTAITQFDKYGNAMGVSTGKAREFIQMQKELLKYNNRAAIEETRSELADLNGELLKNTTLLRTMPRSDGSLFSGGLTADEIQQLQKRNQEILATIKGLELRRKALTGDYLDTPAPVAPKTAPTPPDTGGGGSGGGGKETKEEKAARLKREREQKATQKHNDQLEQLMEQARARTAQAQGDSFEKEQIQFGDHYSTLYKLAGGNKEKMAEITELMYKELGAIVQKEDERQKKEQEKKKEEQARQQKEDYEQASLFLQKKREDALREAERNPLTIKGNVVEGSQEARRLEILQQYLEADLLLRQTHAQDVSQTEAALTDNFVSQQEIWRKAGRETVEYLKEADRAWLVAKQEAVSAGLGLLQSFFARSSAIGKAILIAEKAWAIASIVINLQKELAAISLEAKLKAANAAAVPFVGPALAAAAYAAGVTASSTAKVRAGISIATIASQAVAGLAQKDDGGFTGIQDLYGSASGFVDRPTRVNAGARSYIVGEKRKEWIMGGEMLANPVMANLAGALQALQVSGGYRNLNPQNVAGQLGLPASPAAGGMNDQLLLLLIEETRQNRAEFSRFASRPINYNHFKIRDQQDYLSEIELDTSL
ncbi:phage tail tape measure protein [Spirosoma sordidisoli]|uniref:Phage tail tape measure protein n=1 Tax=Spirosoma sordidisoli TaxID=2502893 RepID=A0A4Q2USC8_9BACT|nr:phage tail tape measure protein [Spirosoma sordidisoli]RYC69739.1 phage tail tape measure protein [Spirosoma sordidisoli]